MCVSPEPQESLRHHVWALPSLRFTTYTSAPQTFDPKSCLCVTLGQTLPYSANLSRFRRTPWLPYLGTINTQSNPQPHLTSTKGKDLVGNGPLLASTIDEEYFASLSLMYTIFSVTILICVELKYNTRSYSDCLLSL